MKSRLRLITVFIVAALFVLAACAPKAEKLEISYEKYTLENGLEVILHQDTSDPIVAVALQYHVGSNREEVGRTGFAHLFEHMMFQESQHVGQDQFFRKIQEAGGMLNGGTGNDGTVYYEVVPKNALEMVLWLEADRLGYLGSTITQEAFANQQGIVKNEKRQGVDNRPYGHTSYVIGNLLYPEGHPYSWTVIGSMEDLTNATLRDVVAFHDKWYTPKNCTLVVAGDYDDALTREWVEKYFGEIDGGADVTDPANWDVTLNAPKLAYHEDNFAKSPELNMVFPTVDEFNKDAYALDFFGQLFSYGKKAPLYKVFVEEKKLAPSVSGYQSSLEITGEFRIRIQTFPNVDLDEVKAAIFESFERFETESFTDLDVERIKAGIETQFYGALSSILGKSFQLASYNEYAGSPGFLTQDLENLKAVTKDDIIRVYETYIKDKPYVMTSFVPMGALDLAVEGSAKADVVEEAITGEEMVAEAPVEEFSVEPIPSSFDRSLEPVKEPDPEITLPTVWQSKLDNGIKVLGIAHTELPLVQFSLAIRGGMLLDEIDKVGVARLVGQLMNEGTANKTPIELEEAIDDLGASIFISAGRESLSLRVNCLKSKFSDAFKLAEEILFEPRWDEKEFVRLKQQTLENINRSKANPNAIANEVFSKLVYGENHIFSRPTSGTKESVEAIKIDDLKNYYTENFSPSKAFITVVGDITQDEAMAAFGTLAKKWEPKAVEIPEYPMPESRDKAAVYFVDVPNAKQSVILIGNLGLTALDPDFYPVTVMNYKLGGNFNGFLNLVLREEKGYTYGARSGFSGSFLPGTFEASSSVQSRVTLESVQIFKDLMTMYRDGISDEDMAFTKSALVKSNASRFETLGGLMGMLNTIAAYDYPVDFIKDQENIVKSMTIESHKELAQKYLHPEKMIYLIVGDAKTQFQQLEKLGLGKPILIEHK
ncbi:MAG: insulinase family protein [Candidatus Aminicenantes bacterium]|nr:insulinase family protein [Candidatus Aminicenantes bacterium]